ncbi:WD repeat-containing protein 31 [Erpetoichthys calabaricus]|uniref:WD repeat-containing protein 31 n=1 Tax=Erpetoichthys calabaricus TaxID=27687 RepID=UPI00223455F8|nr:WD repeat-containing protein 31 [Erpetoichthys calabaricus]
MGKLQSKGRRSASLYRQVSKTEDPHPGPGFVQFGRAHEDTVTAITTVNSDLCLSGGRDKAVVVYDWRAGSVKQRLLGHDRDVTKVACVYGSSRLFSASRDKRALMWNLQDSSRPAQEFVGHDLVVNGLAVSPDGSSLCTGSRDNSVCLWDTETGGCLNKATISRNLVTHLSWIPGSACVVQTSEDKIIRVWDSRGLQVVQTLPPKQYIQVHCDASQDGRYCLTSSNGFGGEGCEATLWDLRQTSKKVCEYRGHLQSTACGLFLPTSTAASPLVATSSHDCSVKIWNRDSAACLVTLCLDGAGPLSSIAACDTTSLLCASFNTGIHLLKLTSCGGLELREAARF